MKLPIMIAVCAGLILSGAAQAGDIKIDQRFSGVSHPTMVDTNGDEAFASTFSFQLKGSPGKATIQSVGEFTAFAPGDCPDGGLRSDLIQQSFVETFKDLSMLFFVTTTGHTCFNLSTFEIGGELSGIITGGTGRFEGATGSWTTKFEAFLVGQTVTATIGTTKGTIHVPD
ncbi:MAG: hypothetical protein OES10_14170 [Gammaproteobacteria bacterium]|nr:hypothetical protein [Gammaproteobacteria bacterium]